jgi:hypothetical protein
MGAGEHRRQSRGCRQGRASGVHVRRKSTMDDYQEELLEARAGELEAGEAVDDATEL